MHNKHLTQWVIIGILGIVILLGLALSVQRPMLLSKLSLFAPTPTPTPISSRNISVTLPYANDYVNQKFTVTGKARVFKNIVRIRVSNKLSGLSYGQGDVTTDAQKSGSFGNFQLTATLTDTSIPSGTKLLLEVFQISPKDGKEIDKVIIPLTFSPSEG